MHMRESFMVITNGIKSKSFIKNSNNISSLSQKEIKRLNKVDKKFINNWNK